MTTLSKNGGQNWSPRRRQTCRAVGAESGPGTAPVCTSAAAPAFAPARTYAPAAPAEEAVAFRSPTASAFAAPRVPAAGVCDTRAPHTERLPVPEPIVPVARPVQTAIEPEPVILPARVRRAPGRAARPPDRRGDAHVHPR